MRAPQHAEYGRTEAARGICADDRGVGRRFAADTMHESIQALIVDPHPAMRRSLVAALEREDGIRVAGVARDVLAALRLAEESTNAVMIVDSGLAQLRSPAGLDALRALACRAPVLITGMGDPELYADPYLAAGASGYWAKYDDVAALVGLLRAAEHRQR